MILALMIGCTSGPPAVEEWSAEILTHSRIMEEPNHGWPRVYAGPKSVLLMGARWGKVPFVTDTEQAGELGITLPGDMRAGTTLDASYRRGYLRLGGQVIYYDSRELTGTILVAAVTPDSALLDLDMIAHAPLVDLESAGERPIRGRVTARFKAGPLE